MSWNGKLKTAQVRAEELRVTGKRECRTCKRKLVSSDFYTDKSQPDGLCPLCKDCKAYYTKWQKYRVTREWLDEHKKNGCEICGRALEEARAGRRASNHQCVDRSEEHTSELQSPM